MVFPQREEGCTRAETSSDVSARVQTDIGLAYVRHLRTRTDISLCRTDISAAIVARDSYRDKDTVLLYQLRRVTDAHRALLPKRRRVSDAHRALREKKGAIFFFFRVALAAASSFFFFFQN